jgi:hypothetical protein
MARYSRLLSSKEFSEVKPYLKYLHLDYEIDAKKFAETFEILVKKRHIFRTPAIRNMADGYIADKGAKNLPKCLIV